LAARSDVDRAQIGIQAHLQQREPELWALYQQLEREHRNGRLR